MQKGFPIAIGAVALIIGTSAFAQELVLSTPIFNPNAIDTCGDARMESSSIHPFYITVLSVSDTAEIKCLVAPKNIGFKGYKKSFIRKFLLAGIGDWGNNAVIKTQHLAALRNLIQGKQCELNFHSQDHDFIFNPASRTYAVLLLNKYDINFSLLSNGFVNFKSHLPYELGGWLQCQYQNAESTAKSKSIGIWNTPPSSGAPNQSFNRTLPLPASSITATRRFGSAG